MKRRFGWLLSGIGLAACCGLGGCVVAPPRPAYVAVAPVRVWVPGYWYGGVWVRGHWRYR